MKKNYFKKPLCCASLCFLFLFNQKSTALTAADYKILLNGVAFQSAQPVQNVNNRILVPYRDIGEALDAQIYWDPSTDMVSAYQSGNYSIMYIGQTTVAHGTYETNIDGSINLLTQLTYNLDSPPVIINGYTYVPLRALGETLGAEVRWDLETGTAVINSSEPSAESLGLLETDYFKYISSASLKNRYENTGKNNFVFMLFDSGDDFYESYIRFVKEAAEQAGTTVSALDVSSEDYNEEDLSWFFDLTKSTVINTPSLYYIEEKGKIVSEQNLTDSQALVNSLKKYSPTQDMVSVKEGDFTNSTYFQNQTPNQINDRYNKKENFLLVVYDREDEESRKLVPLLKAAAEKENEVIYALDIHNFNNFHRTVSFLREYSEPQGKMPILVMALGANNNEKFFEKPDTLAAVQEYIWNFRKEVDKIPKSDDIPSSGYYYNASAENIYNAMGNGDDFMLLLYDSNYGDEKEKADNIVRHIKEDGYNFDNFYMGLNEGSPKMETYTEEEYKRYTKWIEKFEDYNRPLLIYFSNGTVQDYLEDPTKEYDITFFITSRDKP